MGNLHAPSSSSYLPPHNQQPDTYLALTALRTMRLTQIFCDRGEKTAAAMENQLTALERKIDNLLASVDAHANSTEQIQPKMEDDSAK